jgi:sugar lactone lactonase YvrE
VAVGEGDTLYIADRKLPGLWKADGKKLSVMIQASKRFRTPLNAIRCVTLDNKGRVIVGDTAMRQVYRIDADNKPVPLATNKIGIGIPYDVAVDSKGNIYVADLELRRLWKLPPDGGEPAEIAPIASIRALAVDKDDNVWVVTNTEPQILRFSPDGKKTVVVKKRVFQFPNDILVNDKGVAFVTDAYADAVWKIEPGKEPEKLVSGKPFQNPVGIAQQGEKLLVVDSGAKKIFSIAADGTVEALEFESQ